MVFHSLHLQLVEGRPRAFVPARPAPIEEEVGQHRPSIQDPPRSLSQTQLSLTPCRQLPPKRARNGRPGTQRLIPTAHQYGEASENLTSASPADAIISWICARLNRRSNLVPKRSNASVLIT